MLLLVSTLLLSSCSSNADNENTLDPNFHISGKITGAENTTIVVEAMSQQGTIEVAKGTLESDGTLDLSGNIPGMGIYQLRLGEGQDKVIPLTLEPNDELTIHSTFQDFAFQPNLGGTKWAKVENQYLRLYKDFLIGQQQLSANQQNLTEAELMEMYGQLKQPIDVFALSAMEKDPSNPFNIVLSSSAMPTMGFEVWDPGNLSILKKVSLAYSKNYTDSPIAKTIEDQVFQIERAYAEFEQNKPGVKSAPEISLKDPNGKIITLSSLKGKIVLVDFWASWCGPCRKENPNVVRLYSKYKDKGFTVFSVSLDEDPSDWKQAIKADGLVWPNHVSDLLGWKTPLTQLYNFESIPHTVLIDRDGKIIATGLRGESLEQKLKEIL